MNLISEMDVTFLSTGRGSPRWMAPELLSPESSEVPGMRRTKASDIYALGCTLLEVRISTQMCLFSLLLTAAR
jgi:serine/threonine protein kinase